MKPATIVSAAAISGDSQPISRDGSARVSSLSRMAGLLVYRRDVRRIARVGPHAAHPDADFLDIRLPNRLARRQAALGDHGESIAHFEQLVQLFRQHEYRDAVVAQVDDLLPD